MKKRFLNVLAACVLMPAFAAPAWSQSVTFDHGASATATGAGAAGTPTLSFNVAAGQNRIVFITAAFERDHCTTNTSETNTNCTNDSAPNKNFAGPNLVAGTYQIQFTATGPGGSITVSNPLAPPAGDLRFMYSTQAAREDDDSTTRYSQEAYFTSLNEVQLRTLLGGAASGTITISLPNVDAPNRAGDEALLTALQFNNVNQKTDGTAGTGIVRSLVQSDDVNCNTGIAYSLGVNAPNTWATCDADGAWDAGQAPQNADYGVLLFGINGYARSGAMGFDASPGFAEVLNPAIINNDPSTSGTSGAHYLVATESDGFSTTFQFRNGVPTIASTKLQSRNGSFSASSGGIMAGFTLTPVSLDLSITKTNTPGVNNEVDQPDDQVVPGSGTTYTLVITNRSTLNYADGAVLTDPAAAGLTKTAVVCTATTGGAVCPDSADVTVAALESAAGIAIPTLPPNGTVTFTVTATVEAGVSPVANTATIAVPDGYVDSNPADNSATDTDTATARLTLRKISYGGVGTFDFTVDQSSTVIATRSLTTTTEGVVVTDSAPITLDPGQTYRVIENTVLASGRAWTLTDFSCTGIAADRIFKNSGDTYTLLGTGVLAGADIVCTVTNHRSPTFQIQKVWVNAVPGDRVNLSWSRTAGPYSASGYAGSSSPVADATGNNTATSPPTNVYIGDTLNLPAETWLTQSIPYTTSDYTCTRSTDGAVLTFPASGAGYVMTTDDAGANLLCSITNTGQQADVAVVKTVDPATAVASGTVVTYTLTVTNNGPADVTNAVLTDTASAGLDCTTPSTTATCSASGGAGCPGATVAVADVLGTGVTIPVLPNGGQVVVTMQCTVTASGM